MQDQELPGLEAWGAQVGAGESCCENWGSHMHSPANTAALRGKGCLTSWIRHRSCMA